MSPVPQLALSSPPRRPPHFSSDSIEHRSPTQAAHWSVAQRATVIRAGWGRLGLGLSASASASASAAGVSAPPDPPPPLRDHPGLASRTRSSILDDALPANDDPSDPTRASTAAHNAADAANAVAKRTAETGDTSAAHHSSTDGPARRSSLPSCSCILRVRVRICLCCVGAQASRAPGSPSSSDRKELLAASAESRLTKAASKAASESAGGAAAAPQQQRHATAGATAATVASAAPLQPSKPLTASSYLPRPFFAIQSFHAAAAPTVPSFNTNDAQRMLHVPSQQHRHEGSAGAGQHKAASRPPSSAAAQTNRATVGGAAAATKVPASSISSLSSSAAAAFSLAPAARSSAPRSSPLLPVDSALPAGTSSGQHAVTHQEDSDEEANSSAEADESVKARRRLLLSLPNFYIDPTTKQRAYRPDREANETKESYNARYQQVSRSATQPTARRATAVAHSAALLCSLHHSGINEAKKCGRQRNSSRQSRDMNATDRHGKLGSSAPQQSRRRCGGLWCPHSVSCLHAPDDVSCTSSQRCDGRRRRRQRQFI